jgi:ADP-ribosyl-[dinitrogen reductase] hydrolase
MAGESARPHAGDDARNRHDQARRMRVAAWGAPTDASRASRVDRARGALLGLATGDALGSAVEFMPRGSFPPVLDMTGGGVHRLAPGQWTDDTSMALCLAESLLESGGFDAADQMRRYVRWWRDGYLSSTGECFDIGNTVRAALARFEADGEPYAGSADAASAGNGSLMRLAPVPIYYADDIALAVRRAAASSRTTHAAPEAVDACRYFAALIVAALNGTTKEALLAGLYEPTPGFWDDEPLAPRIADIAAGSFRRREPPAIRGTGYVVNTLEAALWALHRARDFRHGALLAVNLGDDADTTGAVYGQLAGALSGASAIPRKWRSRVHRGAWIGELAERLLR